MATATTKSLLILPSEIPTCVPPVLLLRACAAFCFSCCFWELIDLVLKACASQVVLVVKKKKNPPANAGDIRDMGSIPGLGRSPAGGHDNPLQYFCLENPTARGAWKATVHRAGALQSWTWPKQLNMHAHHQCIASSPPLVPLQPVLMLLEREGAISSFYRGGHLFYFIIWNTASWRDIFDPLWASFILSVSLPSRSSSLCSSLQCVLPWL